MTKQSTIDKQELAKFSALADHWWDQQGALKTLHHINPTRLEFIKQHAELKGTRVLDVGCGGGILAEAMALSGAVVTGIDAEDEAIGAAKAHAKKHKLTIEYLCTPIENYEAEPFDLISCMEMLEHVPEPELVILHCARLLKPGGRLFLSTINRTITAYGAAVIAAEYILRLLPKQTHDYSKFIKPGELAAMARSAGLELTDLQGIAYNPFKESASLQESVAVNYVALFRK